MNAIDLAAAACENIREADQCRSCPLMGTCLNGDGIHDTSTFNDVGYNFNIGHWMDFLDLSDEAVRKSAADEYDYADMRRQEAIEEAMIDETHGL